MGPILTLTPEMIRKYESEGTWPNRSLIEIFDEVVSRTPDKVAIVGADGRHMTYAEVAEKVACIAGNLAAAGVQARDVISLQLPNWPEFVFVHLAATRLGAVTNPLLPSYRSKELSYILKFASSKVAVIPATFRGFSYPAMYAELKKGSVEIQVG